MEGLLSRGLPHLYLVYNDRVLHVSCVLKPLISDNVVFHIMLSNTNMHTWSCIIGQLFWLKYIEWGHHKDCTKIKYNKTLYTILSLCPTASTGPPSSYCRGRPDCFTLWQGPFRCTSISSNNRITLGYWGATLLYYIQYVACVS